MAIAYQIRAIDVQILQLGQRSLIECTILNGCNVVAAQIQSRQRNQTDKCIFIDGFNVIFIQIEIIQFGERCEWSKWIFDGGGNVIMAQIKRFQIVCGI